MEEKLGLKFKNVKIDFIFSFFINKELSLINFQEKYTKIIEAENGKHDNLTLMNILCNEIDCFTNKFKFRVRNDIINHCNKISDTNLNNKVSKVEEVSFYDRSFCDNYTRRVILPNLRVKKHECFKKLDFGRYVIKPKSNTEKVNWDEITETNRLEGLVRIMDSGIGTFTLSFYINKGSESITSETIFKHYTLLNLSDNKQYEYPQIITEHDPFFSYANLENEIKKDNKHGNENGKPNRLINKLSRLLNTLFEEKGIITFGCEKHQSHNCNNNDDCPGSNDALLDHSPYLDCQNPYIVVTGKLEKKSIDLKYDKEKPFAGHPLSWWNYYDGKGLERIKPDDQQIIIRNLKETMILLLRYIIGKDLLKLGNDEFDRVVPIPFYRTSLNVFMKNYSYFEQAYIASHHRTTVLFHEDISDEIDNKHIKELSGVPEFVSDSILDLFETIRMRWHFSVILNELLDTEIRSLANTPAFENKKFAHKLLLHRKQFAFFLSDPLTYSYGGTLVNDLIERSKESFQLDYLKDSIDKKFEVIDSLIRDLLRVNIS